MANNLRIIYQNIADSSGTTLTASSSASSATSVANLLNDTKSLVWRSTGKTSETITVNFTAAIVGGVCFPFCNLSSTAKIDIVGTLSGVTKVTETNISAAPYIPFGLWNWGIMPLGVNAYSYGGGTYGRVWFENSGQQSIDRLVITIRDTNNTSSYIEMSRIVIGAYWSPRFNTTFGLSTSPKDLSTHARTDSGDLATTRGIKYNTMNFDLKWLDPSDRNTMSGILKGNGIPKPLFISLFPNDPDSGKEQAHQIYGKLSQLGGVSHPIFDMYSTSIDIEEI